METEGLLEVGDGRRVGWLIKGPENGRTAVYLHGQPGSRRDVRGFPDELLERWRLRLLAIDRGGYGETSPAGLDRRDVVRDLFAVADHVGWARFPVLAVSMGGVYALTAAALAPERVTGVVLAAAHVLPYDDDTVIADLSEEEQADIELLRQGAEVAGPVYAKEVARWAADPGALLPQVAAGWSREEQEAAAGEFGAALGESLAFGVSGGHLGVLEDGLRTLRPLEVDLADVRCRVLAIHGDRDDLEPYSNLQRLLPQLHDARTVLLPGFGHLAPWVWPDLPFVLLDRLSTDGQL
jgi:pimeloyl-ACP methyl ester carboxylesterase